MANNFKILPKNINHVTFDEAPSRISELIMKDETMVISQANNFTINGTTYPMGSIAYHLNENSVAWGRHFKDTLGLPNTTNNFTTQIVTADFADIWSTHIIYKDTQISARVL